ncbi:hypothetical protein A1F94_013907 [Pyrenophora tritici-repentis]|nr:hypothetical protein A1F94_013907 [Pyrenophora tritici-repentis]
MGRNCEKYLAKLEKHHQRGDYTKVEELWKKFGCLGRLHNLVRYIRLTPQRREEFATIIIGGDLSQFDGLGLSRTTRPAGTHAELANRFPEDTDLPPAYYAAQILIHIASGDGSGKWVLHGDEEKKRWFENAQLAVNLWETEYKEGTLSRCCHHQPGRRDPDPAFDRQREHKRIRIDAPVSTTDLYEQYISTDRLHNEEAGCNEAIASAKLTIVDRRGRLKADIIEACECLRAWYGKPQAEGNSDIEDSENEDD